MLLEIYSPDFKGKMIKDNKILFKEGLNVVLGMESATNSIGKSSALLAIDFVFGGDTYLKSDGVKHLKSHVVYSTFRFDDGFYYFGRSVEKPKYINVYEKPYSSILKTISKSEFTDFLKQKYNFDYAGLSFRDALSSFFRVYGKENANERYPLQGIKGRGQEKSIETCIKVFNKFDIVEDLKAEKDELKDKVKAYKDAQGYSFISNKVATEDQFKNNERKIYELELKKSTIKFGDTKEPSSEEVEKLNKKRKLEKQVFELGQELRHENNKAKIIDFNIKNGFAPKEADIEALAEFFPDVSLRKIYEVEEFHEKLSRILKDDFRVERERVNSKAGEIKAQIKHMNDSIKDLDVTDGSMNAAMEQYIEIVRDIESLKRDNDAYLKEKELQQLKQEANENYKTKCDTLFPEIENPVNEQMEEFNKGLYSEPHKPPHLHFNSFNSYSFETPDDTGAGTNYKGMILYDLAVLKLTGLPAIAHDSNVFKNVGDAQIDGILKIYTEFDKQVFIALDKPSSYTEDVKEILFDNKVLELSDDNGELYGDNWNKVKTNAPANNETNEETESK